MKLADRFFLYVEFSSHFCYNKEDMPFNDVNEIHYCKIRYCFQKTSFRFICFIASPDFAIFDSIKPERLVKFMPDNFDFYGTNVPDSSNTPPAADSYVPPVSTESFDSPYTPVPDSNVQAPLSDSANTIPNYGTTYTPPIPSSGAYQMPAPYGQQAPSYPNTPNPVGPYQGSPYQMPYPNTPNPIGPNPMQNPPMAPYSPYPYQQQPGMQAGYVPYYPPYAMMAPPKPGNGLAVASMVLGIVSLVMFCLYPLVIPCAIVGIILGIIAKVKGAGGMAVAVS